MSKSTNRKSWIRVALLLTIAVILSVTSMAGKSATIDEVPHLAAGYSYWMTGDYRMNFEHPPLLKMLAAAPLLILKPRLELDRVWNQRNEWVFGQQFLYHWNAPDRLLFWGRIPIIALFALLGLLVYTCACDFYGPKAGMIALLLYTTTPDMLAHGQLVTTDLGITLFIFSSVYCYYRALKQPSPVHTAGLAISVGLAAVSKYSVAVLVLILAALSLGYILRGSGSSANLPPRNRRLKQIGQLALASLAATWLIIWLCYGFRHALLSPLASPGMALNWGRLEPGVINDLIKGMNSLKLLPEGYLFGAAATLKMMSGRVPYFMGAIDPQSWRLFYPVSFALKTPLPLLALIGATSVQALRCKRWDQRTLFLLTPVILYFAVAVASKIGIGNRHLLPIYPFLFVWASQIGEQFSFSRFPVKSGLLGLLLLWQVVGTLRIYPNFLTFFNELAGGPQHGYLYMVDSNLDWGQDLKELAAYRDRHADEPLYVSYFGMADPGYYLKNVIYLQSYPAIVTVDYLDLGEVPSRALVAISATKLMSRDLETSERSTRLVAQLRLAPPVERLGNSILVFRMP